MARFAMQSALPRVVKHLGCTALNATAPLAPANASVPPQGIGQGHCATRARTATGGLNAHSLAPATVTVIAISLLVHAPASLRHLKDIGQERCVTRAALDTLEKPAHSSMSKSRGCIVKLSPIRSLATPSQPFRRCSTRSRPTSGLSTH